jgi:dihydrofolate reductase
VIVTLVVAADLDGVIGRDGDLPWRLPADLKRFKAATRGHAVIMGRRTWLSLPKRPLVDRLNVVLTRDAALEARLRAEGAEVAQSLDDAVAIGARFNDEVMIIGGAAVYAEALPRADRLLLTVVHTRVGPRAGDAHLARPAPGAWVVRGSTHFDADEANAFATTVFDLVRSRPRATGLAPFTWPAS